MPFLQRLSTLARADAHGVVDALEDPRLLVRQHVREANEALDSKRARLEALAAEGRDLERSAERITTAIAGLEADISLGLAEEREDLARFAIEKLLPLQRRLRKIEERRRHLHTEHLELEAEIDRQSSELDDLKTRARAFLEQPTGSDLLAGEPPIAPEEVELELLRRQSRGEFSSSGADRDSANDEDSDDGDGDGDGDGEPSTGIGAAPTDPRVQLGDGESGS